MKPFRPSLRCAFLWLLLTAWPLRAAQIPNNWTDTDIGPVAFAGWTESPSSTLIVRGSGADVWGASDAFHFRYVPWKGDGQFMVRVTSITQTDLWAKAGLMIRADLSPGSAHAFACVNPQKIGSIIARPSAGAESTAISALNTWQLFLPMWLKVTRQGNRIEVEFSPDAGTWQPLGTVDVALPETVYVGLAVTGHTTSALCEADFDLVTLRGLAATPPSGLRVAAFLPSHMQLTWVDNSTTNQAFLIERSTDGVNFAQIAVVSGAVSTYSDSNMVGTAAPITYSYRVQSLETTDASVYSLPASAVYPSGGPGFVVQQIGPVQTLGKVSYDSRGIYTLTATGADFNGTADSGLGYFEIWQGDGDIIARVTSIDNTNPWAKSGVMIRESNWPEARCVGLFVTPGNGVVFQSRAATRGPTELTLGSHQDGWTWLRLTRRGHVFTAYESTDGIGWALVGSATVEMTPQVYLGLAATAHDNSSGIPGSSWIDNVTLAPVAAAFPVITAQPVSGTATWNEPMTFSANAAPTPYTSGVGYQWYRNGQPLAGATSATFTIPALNSGGAALYTVAATSGESVMSQPAILGFTSAVKIGDFGQEIATNVQHPNGNVYDQVELFGSSAVVRADPGQVTRISFIDLSDDIVQVEFSGAGALALALAPATGPAPAVKYNQPNVSYVRGHAGIVISGADETTNVSIFSVGRANAVNQALFRDDVTYDGVADIAFIAVLSANGRFGGIRAANASFSATKGTTGVYAPGVTFTGPIWLGDINAFESADPALIVGAAADVRIAGGDLAQINHRAVRVNGFSHLQFTGGQTSQGASLPAQTNHARLERDSVDVTTELTQTP